MKKLSERRQKQQQRYMQAQIAHWQRMSIFRPNPITQAIRTALRTL